MVKCLLALAVEGFLFFGQLFPLVVKFLLVETSVVQFITFVPQQQVVAQNLGVVDFVFQLNDVCPQLFDLCFHFL